MRQYFKRLTLIALVICTSTVSPSNVDVNNPVDCSKITGVEFIHALSGEIVADLPRIWTWGPRMAERIMEHQTLPPDTSKVNLHKRDRRHLTRYEFINPIIDHDKKVVRLQCVSKIPVNMFRVHEIFYSTCVSDEGPEHIIQALNIMLFGPDSKVTCFIRPIEPVVGSSYESPASSRLAKFRAGYYSVEELIDIFESYGFLLMWDNAVLVDDVKLDVNRWFGAEFRIELHGVSKLHKAISFAEQLSAETGMSVAQSLMFMGCRWANLPRMALVQITPLEGGSYSFKVYNRFQPSNQQDELDIKLVELQLSDPDGENAWWKPEYAEVHQYENLNLTQSVFGKVLHSIKIGSKEFVAPANMLLTEEVYDRMWHQLGRHVLELREGHIHAQLIAI